VGLVDGKIALVTGGASGIGRAASTLLGREGASVLVCDLDEDGGESTAAAIREAGGQAVFRRVDVSVEEEVEAMVAHCVDHFGRLDCALNNAGITGPTAPIQEVDTQEWHRTLAINLGGVFFAMKHEIPVMQAQGGGSIVNTASGAGLIATPFMSAYCASKHAILGITKTAAVENAGTGVRVNAICPGTTDTPMLRSAMSLGPEVEKMIRNAMPGGRFGEPEEVAEAAVWLCSDRASFVSGESMLVDGATVAR
jgi:NAD(P)-dependent dehydrogenase (short-subunit alcohol dehydrogenase family)